MIRKCRDADFEMIWQIINDGAQAYKGIIPEDRWHDPYMSREQLAHELEDGVLFWGYEEEEGLAALDASALMRLAAMGYEEKEGLVAVMGIQDKGDAALIRHAYVRTSRRNRGIGGQLLRFLEAGTTKPMLIGTWAAATWAIAFYEKKGYRLLETEEKNRLLRKYWTIPERQMETSVVLANARWGIL